MWIHFNCCDEESASMGEFLVKGPKWLSQRRERDEGRGKPFATLRGSAGRRARRRQSVWAHSSRVIAASPPSRTHLNAAQVTQPTRRFSAPPSSTTPAPSPDWCAGTPADGLVSGYNRRQYKSATAAIAESSGEQRGLDRRQRRCATASRSSERRGWSAVSAGARRPRQQQQQQRQRA